MHPRERGTWIQIYTSQQTLKGQCKSYLLWSLVRPQTSFPRDEEKSKGEIKRQERFKETHSLKEREVFETENPKPSVW